MGGGAAAIIGAAALPVVLALVTTGGAPHRLGAQAPSPARAGVHARDSVIVQFLNDGVRIDSMMALVRAWQQEGVGSPGWLTLRAKIDSLLAPSMPRMLMTKQLTPLRGWIGINVGLVPRRERITDEGDVVLRYGAHPLIVSVTPESPAQRAGITPGDVLVAYNGIDVVGSDVNMSRLLVPERKLSVTIRRDGEIKDYSLQVARLPTKHEVRDLEIGPAMGGGDPPAGFGGRMEGGEDGRVPAKALMVARDAPFFGAVGGLPFGVFVYNMQDGLFGARISNVGTDLARALKLQVGVLVNDVSEDSPAGRAGLRAGDVIVSAAGQPVATMERLKRVLATKLADHSIELQVVRERKARTVTVGW